MFPDLKVRYRLLMMPLLATAALFIVFIVAEISGAENQRLLRSLSAQWIPALESSRGLETTLESIQRALQDAVAGEDETLLREAEAARDRFLELISELRGLGVSGGEDLDALENRFLGYFDLASQTTLRLIYEEQASADLVMTLETMTQSYSRLSTGLRARTQQARQEVSAAFEATVRNDRNARIINGVHIFSSAILLCVVSFYLARSLTRPLSDLVGVLRDYESDTSVRAVASGGSEVSELALAFNEMMDKIGEGTKEIEAHSWLMTGLTDLADSLAAKPDLGALGDSIVATLCEHTGALVGALYLAEDAESFKLAGGYGLSTGTIPTREFRSGDGLLGQVTKDRKTIRVEQVPESHIQVASGLGVTPPRNLLIAPIEHDGQIAGVIELGAYGEFSDPHVEFVELSGERIAIAVESLRNKLRLQGALHETRWKRQELEQSRRELARANMMLEEKTERLETSNRDLEAFAYVASHDLQEPLRKIEVYGQRLEQKCAAAFDERGTEYLTRMRAASRRMRTLINDLLGFSRVTTRAAPLRATDLGRVVEQVIADLEVSIEQTGAEVRVGQMPTVHGDPLQLGQVFQNLISNGLKFGRPGIAPSIEISAKALEVQPDSEADSVPPREVAITVEDNGIGIEEKHFEKIFEVFQRLHGRSQYEGTGIGLALCKKIIRRHGGDIAVNSVPGQGSSFTLTLPISDAREESDHESAA